MRLRFDFKTVGWPESAVYFSDPIDVIVANSVEEVVPAIEAVNTAANRGHWAAGFVAYEAAPAFDHAFETHAAGDTPLVWFGIFSAPKDEPAELPLSVFPEVEWQPSILRSEYDSCVTAIREAEGRGDLYQANYTFPLRGRAPADPYTLYQHLQRSSQCGYGAYLDIGDITIISVSPELFFRFDVTGGIITARPMKGTRPRGRWLEEDLIEAKSLATAEKDRAENLMIVDLLRNDLGKIAVPGTVNTPALFTIEQYPSLWQMTSTITASKRPHSSLKDVFAALFPCGSVTGAPKIAAMKQIAKLEQCSRGVYCGAIGIIRPGGDAIFSVGIRTMIIDRKQDEAIYPVGGGITWDSTAGDEYKEALSKAIVLTETGIEFDLVETLRLENGEFYLLQRHIDRITDSAQYFGRPLSKCEVDSTLCACAEEYHDGLWRVRLLANCYGEVRTECAALFPVDGKQAFRLAERRVSSRDRYLFHKTTNREVYGRAIEGNEDVYDVLLSNEFNELTEFTRGNLVVKIGSSMLTPPRRCGLLAGTLRQELLEQGKIIEDVVTFDKLNLADGIWFINSVQGWIEMEQKVL